MKKILFLGAFSLALLNSCLKTEVIPTIPEIKFNSIQNFGDSINILIDFTDGDGNFGLEQGDTSGIFDDCLRTFNLYAEYYEKVNGEWVHTSLDPCANPNAVPFYYRVPWAKPTGQNPTQKGTITLAMKTYYFPNDNDTLRFDIKIVDRDMQESNTISTAEILKP
ncbi:MAG: hypothetical protein R2809_04405 [Flavobacteriales bacterium]